MISISLASADTIALIFIVIVMALFYFQFCIRAVRLANLSWKQKKEIVNDKIKINISDSGKMPFQSAPTKRSGLRNWKTRYDRIAGQPENPEIRQS